MKFIDENIEDWFKRAMNKHSSKIISHLKMCARLGLVDNLKENLEFFQLDLVVEMLNIMKNEGHEISCSNVAFRFEYKIKPELEKLSHHYLLDALRVQYQNEKKKK